MRSITFYYNNYHHRIKSKFWTCSTVIVLVDMSMMEIFSKSNDILLRKETYMLLVISINYLVCQEQTPMDYPAIDSSGWGQMHLGFTG